MVTTRIVLDARYKKKDNTCPLKLRIVHNRQTYHISLGYSIPAKDWDDTGQLVKSTYKAVKNIARFNAIIHKEKQKALDAFNRLQEEGQLNALSFKEIKKVLAAKDTQTMTLAFGDEIIDQLREAKKHGNARVYDTMLRSVSDFVKGRDFPMQQITYTWLKRYEAWYLAKGNSLNGLSVNMRTLRALYNRAVKQKQLPKENYPFADYTIKQEGTRKRAITAAEIERLRQFEPQTQRHERAKDYFFLSFFLMGASFVDLAHLKVRNITGGRIEYKRRKTGRLHSIPVSPALQALLDKYLPGKEKEDFILDIIKANDPRKQSVNVRDELRRFNRTLKEIGELCGIESTLTSYVARHSYATIAKYKGVPTAVISEALGHASEEVTQVYLDSFDKAVLDQYHSMIIGQDE